MFPLNRAQDFANALDISVDYLLGYNEEQMNEQLNNLITDLEEKINTIPRAIRCNERNTI